jgi:hypothetical protein
MPAQGPARGWTERPGMDRLFRREAEAAQAGVELRAGDAEEGATARA